MSDDLVFEETGPVVTLSFNRPAARNALTLAMLAELAGGLQRCAARTDLRAVVLRGAGQQPFSAGYNIDQLPSHSLSAEDARRIHAPVRAVAKAILECPHPVIGAARKFIFGAALDIFCHCDLRMCTEGTTFCMPPNRYGFLYPSEGMQALADVIGLSHATEMLLLGVPIPTADAAAWGLVQKVFAPDAFEAGLKAICDVVANNAPLSMRETKRALQALRKPPGDGSALARDRMYARIAASLNSTDVREAMTAFREKRPPQFLGH